jgi:hypothetical protein
LKRNQSRNLSVQVVYIKPRKPGLRKKIDAIPASDFQEAQISEKVSAYFNLLSPREQALHMRAVTHVNGSKATEQQTALPSPTIRSAPEGKANPVAGWAAKFGFSEHMKAVSAEIESLYEGNTDPVAGDADTKKLTLIKESHNSSHHLFSPEILKTSQLLISARDERISSSIVTPEIQLDAPSINAISSNATRAVLTSSPVAVIEPSHQITSSHIIETDQVAARPVNAKQADLEQTTAEQLCAVQATAERATADLTEAEWTITVPIDKKLKTTDSRADHFTTEVKQGSQSDRAREWSETPSKFQENKSRLATLSSEKETIQSQSVAEVAPIDDAARTKSIDDLSQQAVNEPLAGTHAAKDAEQPRPTTKKTAKTEDQKPFQSTRESLGRSKKNRQSSHQNEIFLVEEVSSTFPKRQKQLDIAAAADSCSAGPAGKGAITQAEERVTTETNKKAALSQNQIDQSSGLTASAISSQVIEMLALIREAERLRDETWRILFQYRATTNLIMTNGTAFLQRCLKQLR